MPASTDDSTLGSSDECGELCNFRQLRCHCIEPCQCVLQKQAFAVKDLVGLAQILDSFRIHAHPFQAFAIQAGRNRRIAGDQNIRRHVTGDDRGNRGETVTAQPAKLVHPGKSSEDDMLIHTHMTGKRCIVCKRVVITDQAIVGDVDIGHDPVVIAEPGDAATTHCAAVDGAEFTYRIVITDFKHRLGFTVEFLVLRVSTDGAVMMDMVAASDPGRTVDDDMGTDPAFVTDLDVGADDAVGTDFDTLPDTGSGMEDGGGMDQEPVSETVVRRSELATILPSTLAVAENFQILRFTVTNFTSMIN